ncbi:MBOAT family protein [Novosphingobium sp. SG720]|uniref:MBOAT family protein n=1 Tax=Novosphingobium sp. SG720 TaxID=2586998 RepID=UPI001448A183|nr:D-alanyl-lipoteichoic acid acyltransferase DltB (MBOAT superfamily) [Novosphingobium sp. SG720]
MLFPTLAFHVFFLAVFALNRLMARTRDWRVIMLLLASWLFYGLWDARFVALLIASSAWNWLFARIIARGNAQGWGRAPRLVALWLAILGNLAVLGWFKYAGFLADLAGVSLAQAIILPVGISFFTFQGLSYVIDVYDGRTRPARLLDLTLLMSFFPHLVAGPIVRPSHLLPQLRHPPRLGRQEAAACLILILWGTVKKAVIANDISVHLVDPVFADPAGHSALELVLAAYGYAVQIYCDFSAYTDMAIGLAGLLGFRFPRNFDQPYRAASLQDFWRRWHISLSSWLRDYLYIGAFGGSRQALWRTCLALFGTMVLGGLWHGASWNFVIWGALHGGVLVAERLWQRARPAGWPALPAWAGTVITFHIVALGWIFFRCSEFSGAIAFLRGMVAGTGGGAPLATPWVLALMALGMACHFGPRHAVQRAAQALAVLPGWAVGLVGTLVLLVVEGLRGGGIAPFIYFQF